MKILKDINSVVRVQYLKIFFWCLFPCIFIGYVLSFKIGFKAILIGVLLSIIVPIPILFIIDRMGGFASMLYRGSNANWSLHEQLEGDLAKAKHLKMKKNYELALEVVDTILDHDPNHQEALFIKAQILWEGFENYAGAKVCLKKIIDMKPNKNDLISRWALNLSNEITLHIKNRSGKERP